MARIAIELDDAADSIELSVNAVDPLPNDPHSRTAAQVLAIKLATWAQLALAQMDAPSGQPVFDRTQGSS